MHPSLSLRLRTTTKIAYTLNFDPKTDALAINAAFRDDKGEPGLDFDNLHGRTDGPGRRWRTG